LSRMIDALTWLAICGTATAQQEDVTFFVIGKHANFEQASTGNVTPVDYSFFSEIFLKGNGDADKASLRFPSDEVIAYRDMRQAEGGDRDNLLLISGEDRFETFADLQARYPDGDYKVSFSTPSGNVDNGILTFQERSLPAAPVIALRQGEITDCSVLAPGTDVAVGWHPFTEGKRDPNGILDDLVFVILTDSQGIRVSHSGRPFEGKPYLTYADESYTIPGEVLTPGEKFTLSVEHAILDDTRRFDGIPAFTTRAVTTNLEVIVGAAGMESCPAAIPPLSSTITMFYY
jgi:hypothetical protein